jgi:eukaryotic-like serine/threonine-protein kinase
VMTYIQGNDLSKELDQRMQSQGKPFSEQEVLPWMIKILEALEYLHSLSPPVIHRDIKPHNIKVTSQGQVYLLDFGISKGIPTATNVGMDKNSINAFTLDYAPFEQIQGTGTEPRSDLFSLASTMYHLLTGESLGEEPRRDAQTRSLARITDKPDPLTPPPNVSPQVSAVIMQALALNPKYRPASAKEMREMLEGKRPAETGATVVQPTTSYVATTPVVTQKAGVLTVSAPPPRQSAPPTPPYTEGQPPPIPTYTWGLGVER